MTYRPPEGFIVSVTFGKSEEKLYDYMVPEVFAGLINPGDRVVVDSPFQGYVVARVVRVKTETDVPPEKLNRIVDNVVDHEYKEWAITRQRQQFERSAVDPNDGGSITQ